MVVLRLCSCSKLERSPGGLLDLLNQETGSVVQTSNVSSEFKTSHDRRKSELPIVTVSFSLPTRRSLSGVMYRHDNEVVAVQFRM